MAISNTKGAWSDQQPTGGVAVGEECCLASYVITAPVDAGTPTGFAVTIPGITTKDKIVGLVAQSATAAALTGVYAVLTANTLTINHGASALAGTEVWHATIMTRLL